MAYNLTTGSGTVITIADGTIDTTSTSLSLPGRNYSGYGQPVDQDLIKLMENFASSTIPTKPLAGQLWYDTTVSPGTLKLCPTDNAPASSWLSLLTSGATLANAITFTNSGSGDPVGTTFNGGAPRTISYNTIGAAVAGNTTNYYAAGVCNPANTAGINPSTGSIYGSWTIPAGSSLTLAAGATLNATYADLAERHHADREYSVGTVVKVGGHAEVTSVRHEYDTLDVLGVVSNSYAYLMNSEAGPDSTHPAIAYTGRIKIRVVGEIEKGDRLVAAADGCAARTIGNSFFGWALESSQSTEEKLILCVIK